ncbi:23S rRNA (guanosine(2251)-2'-O)-methyltransferase RlmB [Alkalitalea saponilacus]|uniref:23S rRNA (Guanosine2251-2'-O)-methyltransferase n=1 Tax=Alkalitalea saponilacus TaxID=889453 RepID=A0A1T5HSV5_9BACT|nr:23S rRNA (guanosine(2251)-2'-O)-methyltransferase RlmB [Alkalitalea saponilacus]ASB50984.1 23S rRNA (guanosine(2251)-2'-O)-methyltransferase RlmB [Alkalitalea saponilacus]SKC23784.1 23S rRNA (guanosine2251-2'-O)-methyltransferase [Alkalitalea saponilacus]
MSDKNLIYGIRAVIEAIESGKSLEKVFVKSGSTGELFQELMQLMRQKGINWQKVPVERINRFTTKNHQGVVATISPVEYQELESVVNKAMEDGRKPFILVLDGITDVRNFGAIARTAECAGVDAIVIPDKGGAPVNADAIKTSAGALFRVPVCRASKMWYAMKFLKEKGFMLIGASEKSEADYKDVNYKQPIALVVGAEDKGISSQVLKMMDQVVSIPVKGESGSLNVSVATGIVVYEIVAKNS